MSSGHDVGVVVGEGSTHIPVRNLWLLYLYASEFYAHLSSTERLAVEDNPSQLVDLAAAILEQEVRSRLRTGLTSGYVQRHETLTYVRDRVDLLRTMRGRLLERGRVACDFEELSVDTPRNRYVCAALLAGATWLECTPSNARRVEAARSCRAVSADMQRLGVAVARPDPHTPRRQTYGHFDAADRRMVAAAQMLFELATPEHDYGSTAVRDLAHDHRTLRQVFETAVRRFYEINLTEAGWSVVKKQVAWQSDPGSSMAPWLPQMETDIVLTHAGSQRRIVADTKFTTALTAKQGFRGGKLKSSHLYQLYTYVRSQADTGSSTMRTDGLLLYPATEQVPVLDVRTVMHGHEFRVFTLDLSVAPSMIRSQLLSLTAA